MRQFDRYSLLIPFTYRLGHVGKEHEGQTENISQGGLCFKSKIRLEPGAPITLTMVICSPRFESDGIVSWCRKIRFHYEVGITFKKENTEGCEKMIEQVCAIQSYKDQEEASKKRRFSFNDAALEWREKNQRP